MSTHSCSVALRLDQITALDDLAEDRDGNRSRAARAVIDAGLDADGRLVAKLRDRIETLEAKLNEQPTTETQAQPVTVRRTVEGGVL